MTLGNRYSWAAGLLIAAALMLAPSSANATVLVPGSTGPVTLATSAGFDTSDLVAWVVAPFVATDPTFTGTVRAAIYRQPTFKTLDFYYQVTNTSSVASGHQVSRVSNTNFASGFTYLTDVYYRLDGGSFTAGSSPNNPGFTNGNSADFPSTADRSSNGSVVGFNFSPPPDPNRIGPGETSVVMVIRTDAVAYTIGTTSLIDGGTATVDTFQPAGAPVPEPGSMLLLGTGLIGLSTVIQRRRRSARQSA